MRMLLRSLAILVVADLFHPFDDLTVEIFLNGDMRHGGGWRRAMPMLFARWEPDHITGMNLFNRTALALNPPATGYDNQGLTERVGVPCCSSAGLEGDTGAGCKGLQPSRSLDQDLERVRSLGALSDIPEYRH